MNQGAILVETEIERSIIWMEKHYSTFCSLTNIWLIIIVIAEVPDNYFSFGINVMNTRFHVHFVLLFELINETVWY